jgi:hypothetical protein
MRPSRVADPVVPEAATALRDRGGPGRGLWGHFPAGRSTLCGESLMQTSGLVQGNGVMARGQGGQAR